MRRGYGKAAENTGKPNGTDGAFTDERHGRKVQRNPDNMGNGLCDGKVSAFGGRSAAFFGTAGKDKRLYDWKFAFEGLEGALAEARKASAAEKEPVREAAARAIVTACGTWQTPTNALGFCFYGAAAMAYHQAGTAETKETYDMLATKELEQILASLKQVKTAPDEQATKLQWNC